MEKYYQVGEINVSTYIPMGRIPIFGENLFFSLWEKNPVLGTTEGRIGGRVLGQNYLTGKSFKNVAIVN